MGKERYFREVWRRSVAKAVSYRIVIVIADYIAVYLFTGRSDLALGFVVISNIYTTVFYFLHERIWDRISWGKAPA